jgi:DNA transposition AAA+ family ATPase
MTTALHPINTSGNGSFSIASHNFEATLTELPTDQAEILRFWFYLAKERSWSLAKVQDATGVSTTVLSKVFRGVYNAGLEKVADTLIKARATYAEAVDNPDFIMTSLAKRFFAAAEKTRALGTVSILWGKMGIGKTTIAEEYQRQNNHGKTMLVRFPVGTTFAYFVQVIARAAGVSTRSQSQFHQREKIIATLAAGKRLLIVDELHQAFLTTRGDTAVKCIEFLREIKDQAGCGLMLVGTEVIEREFFKGQHKEALAQLVDRGTVQIPLPSKPTKSDILAFLRHYGLTMPGEKDPEAARLLDDILKASGLRKLTDHLRDGAAYAGRKDELFTWDHFTDAFDAIASLSKI